MRRTACCFRLAAGKPTPCGARRHGLSPSVRRWPLDCGRPAGPARTLRHARASCTRCDLLERSSERGGQARATTMARRRSRPGPPGARRLGHPTSRPCPERAGPADPVARTRRVPHLRSVAWPKMSAARSQMSRSIRLRASSAVRSRAIAARPGLAGHRPDAAGTAGAWRACSAAERARTSPARARQRVFLRPALPESWTRA